MGGAEIFWIFVNAVHFCSEFLEIGWLKNFRILLNTGVGLKIFTNRWVSIFILYPLNFNFKSDLNFFHHYFFSNSQVPRQISKNLSVNFLWRKWKRYSFYYFWFFYYLSFFCLWIFKVHFFFGFEFLIFNLLFFYF